MYTDEQLSQFRDEISGALDAIQGQIHASDGDKDKLQDAYEELDRQRSRLSSLVSEIDHDSVWSDPFKVAYNGVYEAAQHVSLGSTGAADDDRPGHLVTAQQHLSAAIAALQAAY
jgi:hypothetical protein